MENKKPNRFVQFFENLNYVLLVFLSFMVKIIIFGTESFPEALIGVAVVGLYGFYLYRNQVNNKWYQILQRQIMDIQNFMSQFKLTKTMKESYDATKQTKVRRF